MFLITHHRDDLISECTIVKNKDVLILILCISMKVGCSAQQSVRYDLLGKLPANDSAVVFAPGLISLPDRFERVVSFSPDGTELYFSTFEKNWLKQRILISRFSDGKWQKPVVADFSKDLDCAEPFIAPNGKRLFFVSNRSPGSGWNYDIWFLQKSSSGWSSPRRLDDNVNSKSGDWHPSVSNNGDLFFSSLRANGYGKADIYYSNFENGHYSDSQNLGATINTEHDEWDPFISPDKKYLIFKSNRPGGYGQFDMYISFNIDSKWTTPKNLGPPINTSIEDDSGDITPDGKYFIFSRRNDWEFMDIYWMKADVIDDLVKANTNGS